MSDKFVWEDGDIEILGEQSENEISSEALRMVAANYADGSIDLDALAECVLAEWVERRQGETEHTQTD